MTTSQISIAVAALIVVGLGAFKQAVAPPAPAPEVFRSRFRYVPLGVKIGRRERLSGSIAKSRVGRWLGDQLSLPLRLLDLTVANVVAQVVAVVGVVVTSAFLVLGAMTFLGLIAPNPLLLVAIIVMAFASAWYVIAKIQSAAQHRQREYKRAVNDFVQLIAVGLTTSRSIEQSVAFAVDVGDGVGFDALRVTLRNARATGIGDWEGLAAFGERMGLSSLAGFASSLERQAMMGTSVAASVQEEAERLRQSQLADLTDRADQANANLSMPTMGMVVGMMLFLAYPIMLSVSAAFT